MSGRKYEVHATVAVSPKEGFTAQGWEKMHETSFKNRTISKVGTKGGLVIYTVILDPMVNAALADLMRPYLESAKWQQVADVTVIHHWRQGVLDVDR